jgi:tRNA threonylcarbamoyladenosine biosynthesis protein TsaE
MLKKYITIWAEDTQKLGELFAKEVLEMPQQKNAVVIGLQGNLGGGKTTFLQGFAKGLGIKEKILSPTFVILKRFSAPGGPASGWDNFYHIDCYRLKNHKDILELDFKNIISDPKNIVAVEWPEKIKKALPKNFTKIQFNSIDEKKREIIFKNVI